MPIYDYACGACGHILEVVHGIHDHGPRFCASCGADGTMRKTIAAPAVVFKGAGWAKKDRAATATSGGGRGSAKADPAKNESGNHTPAAVGTSDAPAPPSTSAQAGGSGD